MRVLLLFFPLTACSISKTIDKTTLKRIMPSMMEAGDVEMICASGTALAPLAAAMDSRAEPDRALVMTGMAAGMCTDVQVWEAELDRLRAPHEGRGAASVDLLEREMRLHALAAARYYSSWQHLEVAFGAIGEECPSLNSRRGEDLLYLLGLSSGVLAVIHSQASGGLFSVPGDIPPKVKRAAACLDDAAFWSVPSALQGAIQAGLPGPDRDAGLSVLAAAATASSGVSLAEAFEIQTLSTIGQDEALQAAIAAYAADETPTDPQWALLEQFAARLIRHESDRIWMRQTGHRTPAGQLGTFPGSTDEITIGDDVLDSLLPPEEPQSIEEP